MYAFACLFITGCSSSHHLKSDSGVVADGAAEDGDADSHAGDAETDTSTEDAGAGDDASADAMIADAGGDAAISDGSTATLTRIEIEPANGTIAASTSIQLTATGIYSDNTTHTLGSEVRWSSSDGAVATVGASTGLALGVAGGQVTISAQVGAVTGTTKLTVTSASLVSIAITPSPVTIAPGTKQAFTATGTFSDTTTQDLSASATWSSSADGVATVDARGIASAVAAGSATITAAFGGKMATAALTVSSATLRSLAISPLDTSMAKGSSAQFVVVGTFSDNTTQDLTDQALWSSSMPSVASVESQGAQAGKVSALSAGSTTISAAFGGMSGSTSLTVTPATLNSIAVTPANASFPLGTTQAFTATGTYSDNTTQDLTASVVWRSSAENVATISNQAGTSGLATSVAAGTTTVSAALGAVMGSAQATVTPATLQGLSITPLSPSIAKSTTKQFTATGAYSDGSTKDLTQSVTWASSNTNVASISNAAGSQGLATGLTGGDTTISATLGGVSISTTLTVSSATLTSIAITPVNPTIAIGVKQPFTATGTFTDGTNTSTQDLTTAVTWSSSMPAVASISNAGGTNGVATGVSGGQTIITAALGSIANTTILRVTQATLKSIAITPANPMAPRNSAVQFTATGTYTDNSTRDLTAQVNWTSSDTSIATIGNGGGGGGGGTRGLATTRASGQTTITATRNGVSATTTLTVTAVTLKSIAITPDAPKLATGTALQLRAVGTYDDNSTLDVTSLATWTSQRTNVAQFANFNGTRGLLVGVGAGTSQITASVGSIVGTTTATVVTAQLQAISVTPAAATLSVGTPRQYTATGTFQGNFTQDITLQVTWSSSDPSVASVDPTTQNPGVVTPLKAGTTNIVASFRGVNGSTSATVQ